MKKILLFSAIIGAVIYSSCSNDYEEINDNDNQAKFIVKEISKNGKDYVSAKYYPIKYDSKGRIIEYKDEIGYHTFQYNGNILSVTVKNHNITAKLNKNGYITESTYTYSGSDRDTNADISYTYDSFGYITQVKATETERYFSPNSYSDTQYRRCHFVWNYTWENGNLVKVVYDKIPEEQYDIEDHREYIFRYDNDAYINNMNINPICIIDRNHCQCYFNYHFSLLGFVGKFPTNMPTSYTYPTEADSNIERSKSFFYEFNTDGSISAIYAGTSVTSLKY